MHTERFAERKDYFVLVCDDNHVYADGLCNEIGNANFGNRKFTIHTDVVYSARDAEEKIQSGKYNLAIFDTCLKPPEKNATNEQILREAAKTDYYGSSLYKAMQEYCPWAKIFVTSRMRIDSSKREFNYAPVDYFWKEETTKAQIAQRVVNYFETEMKRTLNNIFVVYGHQDELRSSVIKFLQFEMQINTLDIYRDSSSGIKNVYDILEELSSKAECAVILLSGDDMAITYDKKKAIHTLTYRARQNVIFEMGLFAGILGRKKVIVLHESKDNFEFPSDINGIFYIDYDPEGEWKKLLREDLHKIGF